ncbi:hypothetical protein [Streptomyces globisporus]|uniref:hypothetical protein n=1 Tax=Streptomyces globisporus TaxID=1908 RepID=UPI00131BE6CF|nr:hypothetical protein [Streptomyces globisporus]
MKRVLPLLVAAAAGTLGIAAPAQAHDTDDWERVGSWSSLDRSRTTGDRLVNDVGRGEATIHWNNSLNVSEVRAKAEDWANDGWCVSTQLRYQVYTNGAWSGHYHYRFPAVDCDIENGPEVSPIYRSKHPVRNVQARVCLAYSDGRTATAVEPCRPWS